MNSNRQAPSQDIAKAFSISHALRHLVAGGWVEVSVGKWRQAGEGVRELFNDMVLSSLMGYSDPKKTGSESVCLWLTLV